ncbi:hypothetical protein ABZZ79_28760 [Streptomyces sp. NPDC006458]|uniref:hypothetical protein n=1 Tax=Streptomyces sp. NPDC006458 TaxID=3154302 RepID=UPI0033A233B4
MPPIDTLLARARLNPYPGVPEDTVPYPDTPCAGPGVHDPAARDTEPAVADCLNNLCEAIVATVGPNDLEFVTDKIPEPHGAWLLGCALHLAGIADGARFWWQFAAAAPHPAAAYCLSLHHTARGEDHAAGFWYAQSGLEEEAVECDTITVTGITPPLTRFRFDAGIPTVLRVFSLLAARTNPARTRRAEELASYVALAVTRGYRRHPDIEIPIPEATFAARIAYILSSTPPWARASRLLSCVLPRRQQTATGTPNAPGTRPLRARSGESAIPVTLPRRWAGGSTQAQRMV